MTYSWNYLLSIVRAYAALAHSSGAGPFVDSRVIIGKQLIHYDLVIVSICSGLCVLLGQSPANIARMLQALL